MMPLIFAAAIVGFAILSIIVTVAIAVAAGVGCG